jgi:alkane 1-monooxygenase
MKFSELKYLAAYIIPLTGFIAVFSSGYLTWSAVLFAFFIIPVMEFFVNRSTENLSTKEEKERLSNPIFDLLLYANLPLIFLLVGCYLLMLSKGNHQTFELVGITLSVGIVLGAGINVAHELGHKQYTFDQTIAKLILLPSLYMHFFIEHNRGHHVNIATPEDPATSRKGEMLYTFWLRSSVFSYLNAWKLEAKRLRRNNKSTFSFENEMIRFQLIQVIYLSCIWLIFSFEIMLFAVAIAIVGFLLLETINYIEHYGLLRSKLPSGRYERVDMRHSWNSNHELGRIILYELTRHSDHHFKANRKYQVLRHHEESPQLPLGYPGSMLMSFIPPLWFYVMNKKLKEIS